MSVQATSIEAYHALWRTKVMSRKCNKLVAVYRREGRPLADFEVAAILEWDKAEVSARRNDLMLKDPAGNCTGHGIIIEWGTTTNPKTKMTVHTYRLNEAVQPSLL